MPWLQIKFDIHPDKVDTFSDALMNVGAASVTFEDGADQPIFEPPPGEMQLWQNTRVVGLFSEENSVDTIIRELQTNLGQNSLPSYTHERLEDKIWERVWMDEFRPICFGKRLWICPSWCEPPQSNAVNIKLDPGLAFGTGSHPTTALCLKWLDANSPKALEVIDYGCGSGILAVAAAMLQASQVWAIDHDPQAVVATNENARINEVTHAIQAGDATLVPTHKVDLLLANILAQPLIHLAPKFAELIKPRGHIVLSGILDHQANSILDVYKNHFDIDPIAHESEWVRISGRRKS